MLDLRSLRISRKFRQRDLATRLGISVLELSKIERCLITPEAELLEKAARVLRVNPSELVDFHLGEGNQAVSGEGYATAVSQQRFRLNRRSNGATSKIRMLDLFCGTGGFSHGFEQTGEFEVVAGIDLLPDRVRTFAENHPSATAICADINDFDLAQLAEGDDTPQVIIGGPPCQGFSSIRPFRTLTERDPRNNLFESFALAVEMFRPDWFVMENVVGMLAHQSGQTLETMTSLFRQIGYFVDWKVLNAALYGLPQRRERLILVGNARGKRFQWPEPTHAVNGPFRSMAGRKHSPLSNLPLFSQALRPAVSVMEAIHDLPDVGAGERAVHYRADVQMTEYERKMRGSESELTLHDATAHTPHMLEIIRHAGYNRNELPAGLTTSGFSTSYSRLEPDIPSVTLTVNFVHPASNKCIHPYQDRALTPREGARLQGFEDSHRFVGTRSQIVKQIGNAVPPILGHAIADALLKQL